MANTRRRRRRRRRRGAGQRAAVIVCSIAVLAGAGFLLLREKPGENVSLASSGAISQEAESLAEAGDKYQLRLAGIEKLNQGDYAEAIVDFEAAILASKGRVGEFETDVLKYRAEAEYMLRDYAAAAHTYQILTQLDGESAEYSYREALSLALAGDAQGSLAAYEKGVSLEEKEKDLSIGRSEVLAEVGKALTDAGLSQDADAIYQAAIQDGSAGPEVFNRMGMGFMETEQYEQALECFEQAITAGKSAAIGQAAEERTSAGQSVKDNSGAGQTAEDNSGVGQTSGNPSGVGSSAESGLALKEASFNRAAALEYLGRYEEALAAFREYTSAYGPDEAAQKEITFLETR